MAASCLVFPAGKKSFAQSGELGIAAQTAAPPAPAADETPSAGDFSAFDFVAGGNNYGIVYGHFGDQWFQAENPDDLMAALPAVKDRNAFKPLFAGRILKERTVAGVGTVKIDSNNFKISLEVAKEQALLSEVGQLEELKATDKNVSVLNHMFLAGGADTSSFRFSNGISLTHDTIISKGGTDIESSGNFNEKSGS